MTEQQTPKNFVKQLVGRRVTIRSLATAGSPASCVTGQWILAARGVLSVTEHRITALQDIIDDIEREGVSE